MVFGVTRSNGGDWSLTGGAGGSLSEPTSPEPWANLGGWWNDRVSCTGGASRARGSGGSAWCSPAARRWTTTSASPAWALMLAVGAFPQPWTVELYDASGHLLRRHPFHGG